MGTITSIMGKNFLNLIRDINSHYWKNNEIKLYVVDCYLRSHLENIEASEQPFYLAQKPFFFCFDLAKLILAGLSPMSVVNWHASRWQDDLRASSPLWGVGWLLILVLQLSSTWSLISSGLAQLIYMSALGFQV